MEEYVKSHVVTVRDLEILTGLKFFTVLYCIVFIYSSKIIIDKFYCLLYYLQFYNDRRPSNLA